MSYGHEHIFAHFPIVGCYLVTFLSTTTKADKNVESIFEVAVQTEACYKFRRIYRCFSAPVQINAFPFHQFLTKNEHLNLKTCLHFPFFRPGLCATASYVCILVPFGVMRGLCSTNPNHVIT